MTSISLDLIDINLLTLLQQDADRSNVELARLVGLSATATLHRVRRLKTAGAIRAVVAQLDAELVGFPLLVHLLVSIQRHDEASHERFRAAVLATDVPPGAAVGGSGALFDGHGQNLRAVPYLGQWRGGALLTIAPLPAAVAPPVVALGG